MKKIDIKVSACIITYNHEEYIRECIEGAINQIVNFDYEIVIGDDCSTDNTKSICLEYVKKYPNLIRFIHNEKNLGMKGNWINSVSRCKGNYISICEGDDFWTDPTKVQKQFDVFLSNKEIALVHTNYRSLLHEFKTLSKEIDVRTSIEVGNIYNNLITNNTIATLTVMVKKEILLSALNEAKVNFEGYSMIDYPSWLYIAAKYKIGYIPNCTATYRLLSNSASHSKNLFKNLRFLKQTFDIRLFFYRNIKDISKTDKRKIHKIFISDFYVYNLNALKKKLKINLK